MNLEIFYSPFTLVFVMSFLLAAACIRCYSLHRALMQEQELHAATFSATRETCNHLGKRNKQLTAALDEAKEDRHHWAEKADETNEELKLCARRNEDLQKQVTKLSGDVAYHSGRGDACDDLRTECKRYAEQLDAANQAKGRWKNLAESLLPTNVGSSSYVDDLKKENESLRQRIAMLVEDANTGHAIQTKLKYENRALNTRAEIAESRYAVTLETLEKLTEKIEALRNG